VLGKKREKHCPCRFSHTLFVLSRAGDWDHELDDHGFGSAAKKEHDA
jgi:hypothetical protein